MQRRLSSNTSPRHSNLHSTHRQEVSQIALGVPCCIFYELSILLFSFYKKKSDAVDIKNSEAQT